MSLRTNVWSGTVALLDELYVTPRRRNEGIGARLLSVVVEEARRRGVSELEVEIDEPDEAAQPFYARHGLPPEDADTGERAFVVRRSLAS